MTKNSRLGQWKKINKSSFKTEQKPPGYLDTCVKLTQAIKVKITIGIWSSMKTK